MKRFFSLILLYSIFVCLSAQPKAFDNATRAVYILDIAKYVKWSDETVLQQKSFNIGVLSTETKFYWELVNASKSRVNIQSKPIHILNFRNIKEIDSVQVLFVYDKDKYAINEINKHILGKHILLITENYDFNKSMINFVVVDGKPKFEANEAFMNKEGMTVSQLFLAHAIKTREEWELLFKKTEIELDAEKEIVKQQSEKIENQIKQIALQADEIEKQKKHLLTLNSEISIKQLELKQKTFLLNNQLFHIKKQTELIEKQKIEAKEQQLTLSKQINQISNQKNEIAEHEELIFEQRNILSDQLKQIEKQRIVLFFILLVLVMVSGLGYFIFQNYKIKKEANIELEKKNKIIEEQRDIATLQRDQIAYQKQHITDSIEYAKRIQTAVLPDLEFFTDEIEHFVFFRPKDIVSGDFYWHYSFKDELIIVVADCTGHGVPGAFMSMLGISLLNEIVKNKEITRPDLILNELRKKLINSLIQNSTIDVKDGMDISICNINTKKSRLQWSGANNPLYIFPQNCTDCIEIKGDKMPVAAYSLMDPFTLHEFKLKAGDTFYTITDGYADQFGGMKNKKFLSKNLRDTLLSIQQLNMVEQGKQLSIVFDNWKGLNVQVDDVTILGVRYSCYSHE